MGISEAHNYTLTTTSLDDPEDIEWDPELMGWHSKPCSFDGRGLTVKVKEQPRASVVLPMEDKHDFAPLPRPSATAWRSRTVEAFKICCLDDPGDAQLNNVSPANAITARVGAKKASPKECLQEVYSIEVDSVRPSSPAPTTPRHERVKPRVKPTQTMLVLLLLSTYAVMHCFGLLFTVPGQHGTENRDSLDDEELVGHVDEDKSTKATLMNLPKEIRDIIFACVYADVNTEASIRNQSIFHTPCSRRCYRYQLKSWSRRDGFVGLIRLVPGIRLRTILVSKQFLIDALLAHQRSAALGVVPGWPFNGSNLPQISIPASLDDVFNDMLADIRCIWIPYTYLALSRGMIDTFRLQAPKLQSITMVDDIPFQWYDYSGSNDGFIKYGDGLSLRREAPVLLNPVTLQAITERATLPDSIKSRFLDSGLRLFDYFLPGLTGDATYFTHGTSCECHSCLKRHERDHEIQLRYQIGLDCDIHDWKSLPDGKTEVVRRMMLLTLLIDVETRQLINAQAKFGSEIEP